MPRWRWRRATAKYDHWATRNGTNGSSWRTRSIERGSMYTRATNERTNEQTNPHIIAPNHHRNSITTPKPKRRKMRNAIVRTRCRNSFLRTKPIRRSYVRTGDQWPSISWEKGIAHVFPRRYAVARRDLDQMAARRSTIALLGPLEHFAGDVIHLFKCDDSSVISEVIDGVESRLVLTGYLGPSGEVGVRHELAVHWRVDCDGEHRQRRGIRRQLVTVKHRSVRKVKSSRRRRIK